MLRAVCLVAVAAAAIVFSAAQSEAQGKKDRRCVANFQTVCMKQCAARGGQFRLCPQYCAKREKELGC